MPSSVSKSASGDMAGRAPRFADSPSGSTTVRCSSTPRKLRVLRVSCRSRRVRAACEGWHPGWSNASATLSRPRPSCTGWNGGPKSTRWQEYSDDPCDQQTLAGMRCAVPHQGSLTLLDFSPGRVAMLSAQDSSENSVPKVVETPTRINAGRCFLRDFTSKLPYCESTNEEIKCRVLMDDEWILQYLR